MSEDSSVIDRYYNPFDVKSGIDLKPYFKPNPFYKQLKSLCDEAVFKIFDRFYVATSDRRGSSNQKEVLMTSFFV